VRTDGGRPRGPFAFGVKDIWNYINEYTTNITDNAGDNNRNRFYSILWEAASAPEDSVLLAALF